MGGVPADLWRRLAMLLRASLVPPEEAVDELWKATSSLRRIPGVNAVAPDRLGIPVAAFGNLAPTDCLRLAQMLRSAFEGADAPIVWFDGLRLEEGATIALGLGGDVEPLADLARFVPEAVEAMRLFVDRRRFRPWLTFGTVDPATSPTMLAAALQNLADWTGEPWAVPGLSLIRTRWLLGQDYPEQFDLIAMH
jgi:2'-5' RNA ligase